MVSVKSILSAALLAGLMLVVGCGPRTPSQKVQPPSPKDEIRAALKSVAETGQVDSSLMLAREKLEELKKTDAAKADALLKDLSELEKMGSQPQQAKAKAQEMLNKLGS